MRLNIDPGMLAPVASLPPSLSRWQEVICDPSGSECYVCLEMVPKGCRMDPHVLPGWLCAPGPELLVQTGVEPTDPSQVKLLLIDVRQAWRGTREHRPLGGLVLFGQIISTL